MDEVALRVVASRVQNLLLLRDEHLFNLRESIGSARVHLQQIEQLNFEVRELKKSVPKPQGGQS